MKAKIIAGLVIFFLCFIFGGNYIIESVNQVIESFERIIVFNQAEIQRKTLLDSIRVVQKDLLLEGTRHTTDMASAAQNGQAVIVRIGSCFDCHHARPAHEKLLKLRQEIIAFTSTVNNVYAARGNTASIRYEKQKAFLFFYGQHIISRVNNIPVFSAENLAAETQATMSTIGRSKQLVTLLVVLGPLMALLIGLYYMRYLTQSVARLIEATRNMTAGNLDYKAEGLRDEFGELGTSLNEMAEALQEKIRDIEASQKLYWALFEGAGDAVFILEAEGESAGRILSANKAAADMHDMTRTELEDSSIQDLDTPEVAERSPELFRRILDGEWIHAEANHRKKDGTTFPVEISAGLLEIDDQKYILAFDTDVTERKQSERALQHAERLASVGEMAAGLAHEIKNPLAGIKVSIEVMESDQQLKGEDRQVFGWIIDEIDRIETLLKNLLNYAKPPIPHFVPLDINRVIEAAVRTAALSIRNPKDESDTLPKPDIEFVKNLDGDLPKILADSSQLQQVIVNLLLNAIHAIGDRGNIFIDSAMYTDYEMQIEIADSGKGIDNKDLERLFQPFFTTRPKGTGLGLSICKRLIEQHSGTIDASRNPRGGLTFTIRLPINQNNEIRML